MSLNIYHTTQVVIQPILPRCPGWFLGCLSAVSAALTIQAADFANIMNTDMAPTSFSASHELDTGFSYVSGSKAHLGSADFGKITEQRNTFHYVMSGQVQEGTFMRLGVDWQRFSFGLPNAAPLPNTLQSASLVMGADLEISDQWLMRVEVSPGVYSDFTDFSFDDFNAPLILGVSYLLNQDLQWFFGLSLNARREIPVLPGIGVRWKFADQWTLMCILPKPRLEYEVNEHLTAFVGGEIIGDTYKVSRNFGDAFNRPNLNGATLDYTEVHAGIGLSWKIVSGINLGIEGGSMIYRDFNFYTANSSVINNDIAFYGQINCHVSF